MSHNIYASFTTKDTPYEIELLEHLLPSLKKLELPYHIEYLVSQGSWLKNVAMKPLAILNTMKKFLDKNIVFLDVDAEVKSYPELFDEIPSEYDIAVHALDWNTWYQNASNTKEVLSGTVWIRNTEKMRDFVADWYEGALKDCIWEQKKLEELLLQRKEIVVYPLPLEYVYISSLPDGREPFVKIENPIIVHYAASRRYKRLIR